MRFRFAFLVVLLAVPVVAAWALYGEADGGAACTPGTTRIDENGNPQICLKR